MDKQNLLAGQFEAHRRHLQRVAYRMLGSWGEADDAVQEAWLRLSRSDVAGIDNLGGWLTTVVARVCLDMFDLPFEEIAPIVGRSADAARQLASRARRRVRGSAKDAQPDVASQRPVVDAFLAAARSGDMAGLLAVLDPDVVLHADGAAERLGGVAELRGAQAVAESFKGKAALARPALVDGALGVVVAPQGRLLLVLNLVIDEGRITAIDVTADPDRLKQLDLSDL